MIFQVNFRNKRSISIAINDSLTSTSHIEVPIEDVIELIHDICDDFDLVRKPDKENLRFAAERLLDCVEGED